MIQGKVMRFEIDPPGFERLRSVIRQANGLTVSKQGEVSRVKDGLPARPESGDTPARFEVSLIVYDPLILATCPHNSDAILALASSLKDRKIRVRSVCSSARHASELPSTALNEDMDWVATIGMHRHCRVSAKDFSSPVGSSSPTDAKD